jgi:hypothetical protein
VIRKRLGRISAAIAVGALLGASAIAAGPVAAKTPGWTIQNVQNLPDTVAQNAVAGYSFTIKNIGSSNISSLYLTDSVSATPEFFWNSRGTVCTLSPDLRCSFGALNAGASIDVILAYRVGTSNFSDKLQLDSTGDPSGKNNSHGDSFIQTVTTPVSSSSNFNGTFTIDTSALQTTGTLGNSNKQNSSVVPPETLIPVTIQDGITSGIPCTIAACGNQLGEWTKLNVANGKPYTAAFKVTLTIYKNAVPGGLSTSDINVLHTLNDGSTYVISAACPASGPITTECRTVTKVGQNWQIVVWLLQNGALRGTW